MRVRNVRGDGLWVAVRAGVAGMLAVSAAGSVARAQTLTTVRVASGLALPLYVTAPPGDYNRAFIVEQRSATTGRIRVLNLPGNTLNLLPYLSVAGLSTGNEEGLLGLAFHPRFLSNGYFFVHYTDSARNIQIVRYQANPPFATSTSANAASATTVLSISHTTNDNHNGGWIAFAPNDTQGYLYIGIGDGGGGNDPPNNAQNTNVLLGKMLRIDIDGVDNIPGNDDDDGVIGSSAGPQFTSPPTNPFFGVTPGADEIYFMGLRNPWRDSFDRATGDLYIGDVGQDAIEEIDFVPTGTPITPVKNFGWRCMEGLSCTGLSGCTCNAASLTLPVHDYSHSTDGFSCSVTGGYVYRGCLIPALRGTYFFADFCSDNIKSFVMSGGVVTQFTDRTAQLAPSGGLAIGSITSFGEDADGELYICDRGGEVFKIVDPTRVPVDCNGNGVDDALEICRGVSLAPAITSQPAPRAVCGRQSATFTVGASGAGTPQYRWKRNGVDLNNGPTGTGSTIAGALTSALTISQSAGADSGAFSCVVTNACGSTPSTAAALTVCIADVDDGTGTGTCDGGITIDDLLYYLAIFDAGNASADVDDGSATGARDGGVTIDDLLYYLARFDIGC